MKVTYLYHSGFYVELEKTVLIFDYYKGTLPTWNITKNIYFFVSHKHSDHFNKEIFNTVEQYPKVEFFLGSDIHLSERYLVREKITQDAFPHIHNVGKNQTLLFEDIKIETLRSTDAGVAFQVEVEGIHIYHGGDLNWWHWEGESKAYNRNMEVSYKKEIDFMKGKTFQIAFIPVDPRLEGATYYGIRYFCENVHADWIFPMHMWDEYKVIDNIEKEIAEFDKNVQIAKIKDPGQEFELWNI